MNTSIEFTRVNNDVNGNPRWVCHYCNLLTKEQIGYFDEQKSEYIMGTAPISYRYEAALKNAKKIGGKKFHNKQYGGGIVFQSYNIKETEKDILELLKE